MKNDKKIKIGVVAPVHNRREITLLCLRSLSKVNSVGLEIFTVIVDDGSTDGTSEAIRENFPEVEIVEGDGNLWFTEGTNAGVRAALKRDPDYILMINDDQIFDGDAIKFMVETAEKYPRSVIGSLLLLWDQPHKLFQVSPEWNTLTGGWRHWYQQTIWTIPEKPWQVDIIVGNCVLIPAAAIKEQGLMDSKRYPNFGDAEYTPRLRKKGWQLLIEPRARVFCQPNTLPAKVRKMSAKEKFDALFVNLGHTQNLRRRFYSNWDGAPNKLKGSAAFFVFFIRLFLGKNAEGNWVKFQTEKPLSETFAETIVKD